MDVKIINIRGVATSIAFKKYLLSCDVDSRQVVLQTCIKSLNNPNETEKKFIDWLQNIADINAKEAKNRKLEIRRDGRWDELHYELSQCFRVCEIMKLFMMG